MGNWTIEGSKATQPHLEDDTTYYPLRPAGASLRGHGFQSSTKRRRPPDIRLARVPSMRERPERMVTDDLNSLSSQPFPICQPIPKNGAKRRCTVLGEGDRGE